MQLLVLEGRQDFRAAVVDTWDQVAQTYDEPPAVVLAPGPLDEHLTTSTFEAAIMPVVPETDEFLEDWHALEEAGYNITYLFRIEMFHAPAPTPPPSERRRPPHRSVPYLCRTRFGCHQRVLLTLSRLDAGVAEVFPVNSESPHERYRKLLNRISEGFWDVGPDLHIAYANNAFKRLFEEPEPLGKNLLEFFDEPDRPRLRSIVENQADGIIIPFTMRLKPRKRGEKARILHIDPTPRFGGTGQYLGGWALIHDVTESTTDIRVLHQERELYALYAVASTLSRGFRLRDLVLAASESIREQLSVDATTLWLRQEPDNPGSPLATVDSYGLDGRPLDDDALQNALHWCETAPTIKPAAVVRDTSRSRNPHALALRDSGFRSVAAIPLKNGENLVGYLWLGCRNVSVMNRNWVSLLISIGHQLGLAVANAASVEARLRQEAQQRQFYRDAVYAITNGKLVITDRAELDRVRNGTTALAELHIAERVDIQNARKISESVLRTCGFSEERVFDIATCVSEAATNTLIHGGGGEMRISTVPAENPEGIRVSLEDHGPGINFAELPHALLKRGYSTAISMGLGYTLILEMMDAVYLTTDNAGTTLLMEATLNPVNTELEAWLAKIPD